MTKDRDLIKIIVESSFILIGFILLFVSNLYQFAYGIGVTHFYPSRLPSIFQEIPISYYLILSFSFYIFAAILGSFMPKSNKNLFYVLITIWSIATISFILIAVDFMLII